MIVETLAHFLTRLSHTYLLPEVARLECSLSPSVSRTGHDSWRTVATLSAIGPVSVRVSHLSLALPSFP